MKTLMCLLLPLHISFDSVLVHSGGVHGGHYCSFIRVLDQWFKFDDERVTKENLKMALEEQYGGEEETNLGNNNAPSKSTKCSNACVLIYIRESNKKEIICEIDDQYIAEHLQMRMKKEQEEKEQARLYTIIKVARDTDMLEHIGKDIYFDLVDHEKVQSFRVEKDKPFNQFKLEVRNKFNIPVEYQRFWVWTKRPNHTYRPSRSLTVKEETQSVDQLREVSDENQNAELNLFLEINRGHYPQILPPPDRSKEDILLFFKLYDPKEEKLRYICSFFVKSSGKPTEIISKLNEHAKFGRDEEIELYEEIKFNPCVLCERVDKNISFGSSQLKDGDIICFQKIPKEKYQFSDVPSFLEYVKNRQLVRFQSLDKQDLDNFSLELSKLHTYDYVVKKVAEHLGHPDPSKIKLTPHHLYSNYVKPHPIKHVGSKPLLDMLVHYNQVSDILYYEVLETTPPPKSLKTLRVAFHCSSKTKKEPLIHNIELCKQKTVADLLNIIKKKEKACKNSAKLRLLEVFHHRIYKIFQLTDKIENISDQFGTLRAEEIPQEEKKHGPKDRLVHVYHFTIDYSVDNEHGKMQNFGEPFLLLLREGETLEKIKDRVRKKLNVGKDEFSEWNFAVVTLGEHEPFEYPQDSETLLSYFQRRGLTNVWEQYLGLEHSQVPLKDMAQKGLSATN